jgi:hypothetical protein
MATPAELLAAYDSQLRAAEATNLPPGVYREGDGPIVRVVGEHQGFVSSPVDLGIHGDDLTALICRQRDYFAVRGEAVEWKTRSHDRPSEIFQQLCAAGFEPEEPETVMIGRVADVMAMAVPILDGVEVRRVTNPDDLGPVADLESEVWAEDLSWKAEDLARQMSRGPDAIGVYVAEAERKVVAAGWLAAYPSTDFAGLFGGATLDRWRRRGIFRVLVHERAKLAASWGATYLQVDASAASAPILEKIGLVAVAITTPYVWTP